MRTPTELAFAAFFACVAFAAQDPKPSPSLKPTKMELGTFSSSLAVKGVAASRAFYEKLGFTVVGGNQQQNWLILRNGTTTIGLFQSMFERNCLTFNPGWDAQAKPLEAFEDVRDLQRRVKAAGPASCGAGRGDLMAGAPAVH